MLQFCNAKNFFKTAYTNKDFPTLYLLFPGSLHLKRMYMEILSLLQSLEVSLPEAEKQQVKQRLEAHVNYLINNDFGRLVQLLYLVDVDERKLKSILLQQPEQDAAQIIAELIIKRQEEKARSRQWFTTPAPEMDNEERW